MNIKNTHSELLKYHQQEIYCIKPFTWGSTVYPADTFYILHYTTFDDEDKYYQRAKILSNDFQGMYNLATFNILLDENLEYVKKTSNYFFDYFSLMTKAEYRQHKIKIILDE